MGDAVRVGVRDGVAVADGEGVKVGVKVLVGEGVFDGVLVAVGGSVLVGLGVGRFNCGGTAMARETRKRSTIPSR